MTVVSFATGMDECEGDLDCYRIREARAPLSFHCAVAAKTLTREKFEILCLSYWDFACLPRTVVAEATNVHRRDRINADILLTRLLTLFMYANDRCWRLL